MYDVKADIEKNRIYITIGQLEGESAMQFDVSRATIRRALDMLVQLSFEDDVRPFTHNARALFSFAGQLAQASQPQQAQSPCRPGLAKPACPAAPSAANQTPCWGSAHTV